MSDSNANILVLPRPGAALSSLQPQPPIPGPSEQAFTQVFGTLLPPAQYIHTQYGKAAYYEMSSPSPSSTTHTSTPNRVLIIHGVQTPAVGMFPLTRALHSSFLAAHFAMLDLWGHGLSDTPVAPHDAALFHDLIDALLEHLNWPTAHLVGFSFGGALTAGYVSLRPDRVSSYVLVAPAGLIRFAAFSPAQQAHLGRNVGDEGAAAKCVLEILEGGALRVPLDWKERVDRGEVVAEAVREWQMREHPGHAASVVGVFRDGGVMDRDEEFRKAVATGVRNLVVLGGEDDMCTKEKLEELGFKGVHVVEGAGHGVVRDNVSEVARYVEEFWKSLKV